MGGIRDGWRPSERDRQDGIRVREFGTGPRIEVDFRYKGVRCRESLNIELTPGNWKYAGRLRAEILNAIERQTFRYGDYFPDAKRAKVFGQGSSKATMATLFDEFIGRCEKLVTRGKMSQSTLDGYRKIMDGSLIPEFGTLRAADFAPSHIREMILKSELTAKTLRNRLSVLRSVLDDAVDDAIIESNPLGRLNVAKLIEKVAVESTFEIDPFDPKERTAFLSACRDDEERDMYAFWLHTGLRPGEFIAASWSKVDWIHRVLRIDTNIVAGVEKAPKTKAGIRDVELNPEALAALERQKANTFLAGGRIWRHHHTGEAWPSDELLRKTSFTWIMKKAGIRWRNMYQIRHTYASTHASSGANLFWLAEQMGHETIEMLIRNYARWIPGMNPHEATKTRDNGHATVTQKKGAEIIRFKPRR